MYVCMYVSMCVLCMYYYDEIVYVCVCVFMCVCLRIHLFQKRLTWCNSEYHDRKELWAFKKFQYNQSTML